MKQKMFEQLNLNHFLHFCCKLFSTDEVHFFKFSADLLMPLKANPPVQNYRKKIKVKVAIPQPNLVKQLLFFINFRNFWKSPYVSIYKYIYLPIYLSIYIIIYLSIYTYIYLLQWAEPLFASSQLPPSWPPITFFWPLEGGTIMDPRVPGPPAF